ncbi:MAG TPA: hypothetical protein VLA88_02475 [Candidatus Saccharimonadales bacterium]|nr:hypothetical protein [Candidatus Saccharimonadales bacterium]
MSVTDKFKTNRDLLAAQQKEFTRGGMILKNIFGISAKHPILSLVFALSFGILVNASYDLAAAPLSEGFEAASLVPQTLLALLFALICTLVVVRLRALHKDLFVETPLNQKKLLITPVSKRGAGFRDTPAYNTLQSLLYDAGGQAAPNALEKVVLVVTESAEVTSVATDLKAFIEAGGRQVELYGISINDKSVMDIQAQVAQMINKMRANYAPHEIIVDYTGGTKDMSIALLRVSEKELITPIYLNSATDGQHSRYS